MYSHAFVCLFGMGTTFFGLICLVFMCMLMSQLVRERPKKTAPHPESGIIRSEVSPAEIAAITGALATELETDPEQMKIVSISKMG